MSIQWEKGRRRIAAAIAAAAAAALQFAAGLNAPLPVRALLALALGGLVFCAFDARVALKRWWWQIIAALPLAAASALVLHLPLMEWIGPISAQYSRFSGTWYRWLHFLPQAWLKSVVIALAMLCLLTAITASIKRAGLIWLCFCLAFSLVDAAVYEFSGNIITVSDLTAIDTALNVVGNGYHFEFTPAIVTQLILFAACFAALLRMREARGQLKKLRLRAAALACVVPCALYVRTAVMTGRSSTFSFNGVRRNGIFAAFLIEMRTLNIAPPEGYSAGAVAALGEKYPARAATVADGQRPHVIAIMIEAFSDLAADGEFETNIDYMPYTRQLMRESISGQALVSTYGGGTARSEWEFLTGNTMGFMPGGSMPYRQFMGDDENSIVKVFKNAGYHTIGMHPFHGNGWGRSRVYPALGFDDIIFLEDSDWDDYVRSFVSDRGFVHKVIDLYESREDGTPMFFFGVTMQNHSDYTDPNYEATVHFQGLKDSYPSLEQYLSLMRESDEAVRELIEYFSRVDEPVQIVFFGDHQPKAGDGFYRELGMRYSMQKYLVPFVMWDNYAHRTGEVPLTSLNFLPARLLDLTGVQKPSYFCFLSALNEAIPAMNHSGFYTGNTFVDYDDETPVADAGALALVDEYRVYQYANMFDKSADRALFTGSAAR